MLVQGRYYSESVATDLLKFENSSVNFRFFDHSCVCKGPKGSGLEKTTLFSQVIGKGVFTEPVVLIRGENMRRTPLSPVVTTSLEAERSRAEPISI